MCCVLCRKNLNESEAGATFHTTDGTFYICWDCRKRENAPERRFDWPSGLTMTDEFNQISFVAVVTTPALLAIHAERRRN